MPSKYAPLAAHLRTKRDHAVTLTFDEVEALTGPLPDSAHAHDAWWLDNTPETTHTQASAGWLAAGWVVATVDRKAQRVTFRKAK